MAEAVQLSLLSLALTICSYDSTLQECMENQGVSYTFEVISQISENGAISEATRDEIEIFLTDICKNVSDFGLLEDYPQLAEFENVTECIEAVNSTLDRITEITNGTDSSTPLSDDCPELFDRGWLNLGLIGSAAFIVIVLSFTKKRHHFAKDIFHGYPGLIIPVNLLQSMHCQFIHTVVFGAMASDILANIFNPTGEFIVDVYSTPWSSTLLFYGQVILQALYFSPLLICTHAPIELMGYSFGLLYSYYFSGIRLYHLESLRTNCAFYGGDLSHLYPLAELPTHICLLIICTWYTLRMVVSAYEMYQWYANGQLVKNTCYIPVEKKRKHQYIIRVKKLLTRTPQEDDSEQESKWKKIVSFIQKYTCDSSFHYPLCFSSAVLIVIICIYQLTFILTIISLEGTRWLHNSVDIFRELLELLESSTVDINFHEYFEDVAIFLEVVVPLVPITAGVFCYVLLFMLVINVREDIKRLYAGDFSSFPEKKPTPTRMLSSGLKYMGFQVGYFVWTWVIALLILYLAVIVAYIYLLLLRIDPSGTLNWTTVLIFPSIISTVLGYVQIYLARYVFLQDKSALSLTNIQVFYWFQFLMIFYNVVVGLSSALLRNIYSLVFGLLLMPRLDRTVMMKGLEKWDSGYKTYIGFMYLNLHHNDAVVNIFCYLLHNTIRPRIIRRSLRNSHTELDEMLMELNALAKDGSDHEVKSKISTNRWLLAYTLMNNPQLQELRGHCIAAKKKADDATAEADEAAAKAGDKKMEITVKVDNQGNNERTNRGLQIINIDEENVNNDKETMLNAIV